MITGNTDVLIAELPDFNPGDTRNSSKMWVSWYWPLSLYMVLPLRFLISIASLIHLFYLSSSVPETLASFHGMTPRSKARRKTRLRVPSWWIIFVILFSKRYQWYLMLTLLLILHSILFEIVQYQYFLTIAYTRLICKQTLLLYANFMPIHQQIRIAQR